MTNQNSYLINALSELEDYAIISMNIDGLILNWNKGAEKIKGYKEQEIIGKNFRIFYTQTDRQNNKPDILLNTALNTGKAQDEGWRVKKDGSLFWGSITITSIKNSEKEVIGFVKITRDLTEKKKSESEKEINTLQINSKNRELEQFAYIASHDLQEPLKTLNSLTDIFKEEYKNVLDSQGIQLLNYINDSCSRMNILIKGLMEYSRIGTQKRFSQVDLNILLDKVIKELQPFIENKKAIIKSDRLPTITISEPDIFFLFKELITNGIKFSKKENSPIVNISVLEKDNYLTFCIRDNGIGINTEFYDKIFYIFQKLHNNDKFEGNGIGLAQCRKIIELHYGKIWVDSEIGNGSKFHFTIPLKYYE